MSVSSGLYSFSKAFVLITEGGISDTKFQHILEVFHETNTSKLAQGKGGVGGYLMKIGSLNILLPPINNHTEETGRGN